MGGEAEVVAVVGEGVEEDVGCGVVGLSGGEDQSAGGGVEDEGGQGEVAGEFVQVPCPVDLRPQHPFGLLLGQGGDQAPVRHSGGVDDRGEGVLCGDAVEEFGECCSVAGVAGGEGDGVGAEVGQFGAQGVGAGGVGAAAAGEKQVPYTVLGHQMPGQDGPQTTGAARDQDRAVRPPHRRGRGGPGGQRAGDPGQAGYADLPQTQRGLGLAQGESGGQRMRRGVGAVDVQDGEPAGILLGGSTYETPQRGLCQVDRVPLDAAGDRAACEHDQADGAETVLGQPRLEQGQQLVGERPGTTRHVRAVSFGFRHREHHGPRSRAGGGVGDGGGQGRHVGVLGNLPEAGCLARAGSGGRRTGRRRGAGAQYGPSQIVVGGRRSRYGLPLHPVQRDLGSLSGGLREPFLVDRP